jgi:hypothetical protein
MRVVHVRVARADFAKSLGGSARMARSPQKPAGPVRDRGGRRQFAVKVQFDGDDLAERFRRAFIGSYAD